MGTYFLLQLVKIMPQNLLSFLTGRLVEWQIPHPFLAKKAREWFVAFFGIDMAEAEHPLHRYSTLQSVFVRRLQPGCRPIQGPFCSPADGMLTRSVPVIAETLHPAKGNAYSLSELIYGEAARPAPFAVGWACTVYLAPHNYHRVHAPVSGTLTATRYIPGKLWPVSPFFAKHLPRLFVENERVVFDIATEKGHVYVVMVGALNVGKIAPAHMDPPFYSNNQERLLQTPPVVDVPSAHQIAAGDELGVFMLGSTVIVLLDHAEMTGYASPVLSIAHPMPVKMGAGLLTEIHA